VLSPNLKKVYLCGENDTVSGGTFRFRSGNGTVERATVSNLYLYNIINERKVTALGYLVSLLMIAAIFMEGLL
jgi:hypothetical protein